MRPCNVEASHCYPDFPRFLAKSHGVAAGGAFSLCGPSVFKNGGSEWIPQLTAARSNPANPQYQRRGLAGHGAEFRALQAVAVAQGPAEESCRVCWPDLPAHRGSRFYNALAGANFPTAVTIAFVQAVLAATVAALLSPRLGASQPVSA